MAINVIVGEPKTQEKEFPKLMKFDYKNGQVNYFYCESATNCIIIFIDLKKGAKVHTIDKIGDKWQSKNAKYLTVN